MVNLPLAVQPDPPASVQVPVMVLPLTVPAIVRVLPAGFPDWTFMPKVPDTFPLKFPLSAKLPLSVSPETKHGELVEN